MGGLTYDWKKRGADMAKLHPTGTPADVAATIEKTERTDLDEQAETIDLPSLHMAANGVLRLLHRVAKSLDPVPFTFSVTAPGLAINAPNVKLMTVHNSTLYAVTVALAGADGAASPRYFIIPAGSMFTDVNMFFPQRMYCRKIYTTSGPFSAANLTVGGTPANLQTYAFNFVTDSGVVIPFSYTAGVSDTNITIALAIKNLIAANATVAALVTATSTTPAVLLTAVSAGSLANSYQLSSPSATGTGTLTATPFSGAASPEIILCGNYV